MISMYKFYFSLIGVKLKGLEKYFLPLASFFILISTAFLNFFLLAAVASTTLRIIIEKDYKNVIEKKFMLYGVLIFIFLLLSIYYTTADFDSICATLKKYVKFLYIPILFHHIRSNKNHLLIINYFIAGGVIVLSLSYLKYFNIVNFNFLYSYFDMNLVGTLTRASVFQTSIVHGAVFSFIFYLSIFLARRNKNYLLYVFSALCLYNIIFMNDSRNSYIIALILLFFALYYYIYTKKYIVTTFTFLFLFLLFISPLSSTLTKSLNDASEDLKLLVDDNYTSSLGLRSLWAINGIDNLYREPILGSGVGSYKNSISAFIAKKDTHVNGKLAISNNPHNEFISLSTQLGLFGLTLYILFLYSLFKEAKNKFLGVGVFVIISISSFFNSALYDNVFGLFIVLIISLVYQKDFIK